MSTDPDIPQDPGIPGTKVPEPSMVILFGAGAVAAFSRRRKKAAARPA